MSTSPHLNCKLCERLQSAEQPLAETRFVKVYQGPFWHQWPGHLMVVFKTHVTEQTDMKAHESHRALADVLDVERAIRACANPLRMNVVKFGNAAPHLHWHLVPRFESEIFPTKSPWELLTVQPLELYKSGETPAFEQAAFIKRLADAIMHFRSQRVPAYFAAACVFRPVNATRYRVADMSLKEIVTELRREPNAWQSLVAKQSHTKQWDNIGGLFEANEFPTQALEREVREEVGWQIGESIEIARSWNAGFVRGFVYAIRPVGFDWFSDKPSFTPNDNEILDLCYFNVSELATNTAVFDSHVTNRFQAIANGQFDFLTEK